MAIPTKQSSRAIADDLLRLPGEMPELPEEILQRFQSARSWMQEQQAWWSKAHNALQEFSSTVQDGISMGNVLSVDGEAGSIFIRNQRGPGKWDDPDTPFYVNRSSYFSLGSSLTWNPVAKELIIDGTIFAVAGEIGGFEIGADYIRDQADSMGLSSAISGGDDVRFWAGDTFANRASAPFRVTESGALVATNATISGSITATSGTIGGWAIGASTISANNAVLDSAGQLVLGTGNDVAIMSAVNATYRLWIGNATAGSATFSVTKAGALTSTSGSIGGWTITGTELSTTGAWGSVVLPSGGSFISLTGPAATGAALLSGTAGLELHQFTATTVCFTTGRASDSVQRFAIDANGLMEWGSGAGARDVNLYRDSVSLLRTDDAFQAASFTGNGSSITSLNASNISSGTLDTSLLPSTINIATAYQIGGTQVVTSQQAAIANAGTSNTLDATYNQAQLEALFNAFGAKINEVLAALRTHGLIDT